MKTSFKSRKSSMSKLFFVQKSRSLKFELLEERALLNATIGEANDPTLNSEISPVSLPSTFDLIAEASYADAEVFATSQANQSITVKVLVLIYNPTVPSEGDKYLWEVFGWNDPHKLVEQYKNDVETSSHGMINIEFVEIRDLNEIPAQKDGFQYTADQYVQNRRTDSGWHEGGGLDYYQMAKTQGFASLINHGEIDEVWHVGDHYFLGWEAAMMGPGSYFINGDTYPDIETNRPFAVMAVSYERGVDMALHNLMHRIENHMSRAYGGWNIENPQTNWDRFTANDAQSNHVPGVGSCHYSPNSVSDYDYGNPAYVWSTSEDWLNYPNLTGTTTQVNGDTWNNGEGWHQWWLAHIPHADGVNEDGRQNNWWKYIYDFNNYYADTGAPKPFEANCYDTTVPELGEQTYTFHVTYTSPDFVDVSTLGDDDIIVRSSNGLEIPARLTWTSRQEDHTIIVAAYEITAPDGYWDDTDAGIYRISMLEDTVYDGSGNALIPDNIGSFEILLSDVLEIVITSSIDENDGNYSYGNLSLREAIELAHQTNAKQTAITFDPSLFESGSQLQLNESLVIDRTDISIVGPGGNAISIVGASGGDYSIYIQGFGNTQVSVSGIRLDHGGIHVNNASLDISDVTFDHCVTSGDGGAIRFNGSVLTIKNSDFSYNQSSYNGGAIYINAGHLIVENSLFENNMAKEGGAIAVYGTAFADIYDSRFLMNYANYGGAVVTNATVNAFRSLFSSNTAGSAGGAIHSWGTVGVYDSRIVENTASTGGGISTHYLLTVENTTIERNYAENDGGGIREDAEQAVTIIKNTYILGNSTGGWGGGIRAGVYSDGNMEIINTVIAGNTADSGGGISVRSNLTIINSTIAGNQALHAGGGLQHFHSDSSLTIYNSIISLNESINRPELSNVEVLGSYVFLNNLIDHANPAFVRNPSQGADGKRGTDDDDYGDLHLMPDSSAIDAGNNLMIPSEITADIDLHSRIQNDTVDIGAYEYRIDSLPAVPTGFSGVATSATSIQFTWNPSDGATGYEILQQINNIWKVVGASAASPHTVMELLPDTSCDFSIRAVNAYGKSIQSKHISVKTPLDVPPAELTVTDWTLPQLVLPGSTFDISWVVMNTGKLDTNKAWVENVYLSYDGVIGDDLLLLATNQHETISPDQTAERTQSVTLPGDLGDGFRLVFETVYDGKTVHVISGVINVFNTAITLKSDRTNLPEGENDAVLFTVTRLGDTTLPQRVEIASSDTGELTVPRTVTIPAGQSSATFYGTTIQDNVKDGNKPVTVTVSIENLVSASTQLTIIDVMPADLEIRELVIPVEVYAGMELDVSWLLENVGDLPRTQFWTERILLSTDNRVGNDVTLLSQTVNEELVGGRSTTRSASVTIPAGTTGNRWIIVQTVFDGKTRTLISEMTTVSQPSLTLTASVGEIEEGVNDGIMFTITRAGDLSQQLEVTVTSSNPNELAVPSRVVIPAGERFAFFRGSGVQDNVVDGNQRVTVTVSTSGFRAGSTEILVLDTSAEKSVETLSMPNMSGDHWTVRREGNRLLVRNASQQVVLEKPLSQLLGLVVNTSASHGGTLTVDLSGGEITLEQGIAFNGDSQSTNTLNLCGTDDDDAFEFRNASAVVNGLDIAWRHVQRVGVDGREGFDRVSLVGSDGDDQLIFGNGSTKLATPDTVFETANVSEILIDGLGGNDTAMIIAPETDGVYTLADNRFIMQTGGLRLDVGHFNRINAFADGTRDKAYVYGENNALIFMNDQYVDRYAEGQSYRLWRSEQVVAINSDDTDNAVIHQGSRGFDRYTVAENYGAATNAVASYDHQWLNFDKATVHSPTVTAGTNPALPPTQTERLFALLAEEQRLADAKKSDNPFDDLNWLEDFEELALRELRK